MSPNQHKKEMKPERKLNLIREKSEQDFDSIIHQDFRWI